jgi:deoxyribodipyrimidine photo-lyase
MTAFRRRAYNFALQHACEIASNLGKPLIVIEALRMRYGWASDRFHRFIIDGMIQNECSFRDSPITYYPFIETTKLSGHGLIEALARDACVLVADDFPCFFHPTLYSRIVSKWPVAVHLVDSNGILPMRTADRTFTVAHSFRRFLQKELPRHLDSFPQRDPLAKIDLPRSAKSLADIQKQWPTTNLNDYADGTKNFDRFLIDHSVPPVDYQGGPIAAAECLHGFIKHRLSKYDTDRNIPDLDGSSQLSPYLHFGHISAHDVFEAVMAKAKWNRTKINKPNGKAIGYWGATPQAEAFLDELITWREIGFNMCGREPDYDRYASLPEWAKTTLATHSKDKRPTIYTLEQLERAQTYDDLWNAAQNQLVRQGRIHNYLRMLWGKRILEWAPSPKVALEYMIELNNKYAVDGRDPNSYSGIFWVLGRYDRAWGPERKIFGKVRYMTSDSTRKKFPVKEYLKRFAPPKKR